MSEKSDALLTFSRSTFPPISILWAVLWGLVFLHYTLAALSSWRSAGTSPRDVLAQICDPMIWAFRNMGRRLRRRPPLGDLVPTQHPGNILRLSIALASLTPISFGVVSAFVPITETPKIGMLTYTYAFLLTSIFAAMGHLFLAYRQRPPLWTSLIAGVILWLALAPWGWYLLVL